MNALRRSSTRVDSDTEDFPLGFRWFVELHNVMETRVVVQLPSLMRMLVPDEHSRTPSVTEEQSRAPSVTNEQPRTENEIATVAVSEGNSEQPGPSTKDAPGSSSANRPFAYSKYSNYCAMWVFS